MSGTRTRPLERDDFLAPAPLFRYGPSALMLVGLLLSASVLAAALWRIEVSRHGEYQKAFDVATANAVAVHTSMGLALDMLQQATNSLQTLQRARAPAPVAEIKAWAAAPISMNGHRVPALVLDPDGQVLAASPGLKVEAAQLRRLAELLPALGREQVTVLPQLQANPASAPAVPVLHRLNLAGSKAYVLYLVDVAVLTSVFNDMLGDKAGWLHVGNLAGQTVAEVHRQVSPESIGAPAARSAAQAMDRPLDYASRRLLVATKSAGSAPLAITVGLVEADVLQDLRHRTHATWTIFGVSMLVVLSLVTVTSLALRKFAVKEAHLRRLATVDILTGLPNRRSFHHLLDKAVRHALATQQVFGLMFVDLDNFKDVNDSLGHEAGDALLQRVGALLLQAVRQGDRVCRLGGDEFTVLLSGLRGADEALQIGQRILDTIAQPMRINDVEVRTRATIGIALMPQHASTMSDLMRFADTAMYRAKHDGKSICLIYDESMAAQALFKTQQAQELAQAITRDELFLEYQPKYCLRSGAVTGYEALVRWMHPARGLVGPGQFIALAEESGLIIDLGQWVLERAVRQLRQWHDAGAGWQNVAINVSALQLRSGRFPHCVGEALARQGVPGAHLQLELTESSLVLDAEQARSLVRQVHSMGSSVAVDDFGTGYSSLAALQQFNIDYLKIDRGFVSAIETPSGAEICRAVVSLAHGLNMRAVAEGVETAMQRDLLRRLGCDEVQGFLYARPMPADQVLRHVHTATQAAAPQAQAA